MNIHDHLIGDVLNRLNQQQLAETAAQHPHHLNVSPSTGRFLELLIEEQQPARILEIGTAPGYATIWLARAGLHCDATIDSVCDCLATLQIATQNIQECQLQDRVNLHQSVPDDFLSQAPAQHWDFIFLNSDRHAYASWWPHLLRISRRLLVVCNGAVKQAADFQPLLQTVDHDPALERTILTIGHGLLLIRHRSVTPTATDQVDGLPLLMPRIPSRST